MTVNINYPADTDIGVPAGSSLVTQDSTGTFNSGSDSFGVRHVYYFSNFKPSLVGSLNTGATYGQTGNTVTVTLTGHGVTANRNGYRFYWPGSAAIASGWYDGLAYVDPNSFTFQNPIAQTVAPGTAITGTLPVTGEVEVCSATVPGNTLGKYGTLVFDFLRSGDISASNKKVLTYFGTQKASEITLTTTPARKQRNSIVNVDYNINLAISGNDGVDVSAPNKFAIDTSNDVTIAIRIQMATGQGWCAVDWASYEILPRRYL